KRRAATRGRASDVPRHRSTVRARADPLALSTRKTYGRSAFSWSNDETWRRSAKKASGPACGKGWTKSSDSRSGCASQPLSGAVASTAHGALVPAGAPSGAGASTSAGTTDVGGRSVRSGVHEKPSLTGQQVSASPTRDGALASSNRWLPRPKYVAPSGSQR